jgi:hypothetical protein
LAFLGKSKSLWQVFKMAQSYVPGMGDFVGPLEAKKSPAEKVSAEVIPCLFSEVKKLWAGCQFIASGTGFR